MSTFLCRHCARSFRTQSALDQHIRDAANHYTCSKCDFIGESWDELLEHCRETLCSKVCQGCNDGEGVVWEVDCDQYWQHVDDENVCEDCEQHFNTSTNLYQHRLSHRAATIECYCCDDKFKTYGGMIIHLERGTCNDTDATELNQLAAECRRWTSFMYSNYHDKLLYYGKLDYEAKPFFCPTCDDIFGKLSSLFQHIESSKCEQSLDEGAIRQLRKFLASRLP